MSLEVIKSIDEEGNISYNLVNLYEKGNEKLLEEQFLEENPSVTREKLDEVNEQNIKQRKVHFEEVEEELKQRAESKIKTSVSKEEVPVEKEVPVEEEKADVLPIDEVFPSNDQEEDKSESIIKSVHTACSVLEEISKYLQKNDHPSNLNLKSKRISKYF